MVTGRFIHNSNRTKTVTTPIKIYRKVRASQALFGLTVVCILFVGNEVPVDWKGSLDIMYRLGPGFDDSEIIVEVDVNNKLEVLPIYNVIGTIYGREEPDRYVLIGNHRDAWVYGAVDASTGTTVTTEIARVLGEMKNSGWRPRRTIKVKKNIGFAYFKNELFEQFLDHEKYFKAG